MGGLSTDGAAEMIQHAMGSGELTGSDSMGRVHPPVSKELLETRWSTEQAPNPIPSSPDEAKQASGQERTLSTRVLPRVEAEAGSTKVSKVLDIGGSSTSRAEMDIRHVKGSGELMGSTSSYELFPFKQVETAEGRKRSQC